MGVIERMTRATTSSNLKCDDLHFDADLIASSGLVARKKGLGALAFWSKYAQDHSKTKELLRELMTKFVGKKRQERSNLSKRILHQIAESALCYWLTDVCRACKGVKFEKLESNEQVLSEKCCTRCKGTGKEAPPNSHDVGLDELDNSRFREEFADCLEVLNEAFTDYAERLAKKVKK
jgi:hypothetical protein